MQTLERDEGLEYWRELWAGASTDFFKAEVLQDYTGEDDVPSLEAWLAGDQIGSMALLQQSLTDAVADPDSWVSRCRAKRDRHVSQRRVRVVAEPLTPYTAWELQSLRARLAIDTGEEMYTVRRAALGHLAVPAGDVAIFDDRYVSQGSYDQTGRMTHLTFYEGAKEVAPFLALKAGLLALATPLE